MATLIIKQPDKEPIRQALLDGVMTIGRVKANTITLVGDTAISRQHCKFEKTDEGVFLSDLGSSNGTRLNGEKIGTDRILLHHGDQIQIGSTVVTIEDTSRPKPSGRLARPTSGRRAGATARADGTVFGDGYVKCGKCGATIDTTRKKPGQKIGCTRCRSIYVLPET